MRRLLISLSGPLALAPALLAASAPGPDYHIVKTISVPGEGGWDYMSLDGQSRRLYISRGSHVVVVNVDDGKPIGDIPDTQGVHGIAVAPKLNRGFTSNGREGTVTMFDLKTLTPMSKISVGKNPDCILYDPYTNRVFTFNGGGNDATAVDATEGKTVGSIDLQGRPEYAVTDGQGHLYVNIEDKNEILELDAKELTVRNRWPISPGEGPSGLAIDTRHRRLFSVCDNKMMVVLNADNGKVVATPAIGDGPDAAAFDPVMGLAFSSNGAGTLTVIHEVNANSFEKVADVPTESGARTMALDPKTHSIYLCTAKVDTAPPPPNGNPSARLCDRHIPSDRRGKVVTDTRVIGASQGP